jgi:hypothetical protein
MANPVLSTLELAGATIKALLTLLVPVLGIVRIVFIVFRRKNLSERQIWRDYEECHV